MSDIKDNYITVPVHPSLIKPILYAGAERELTICLAFSAMIIWVAGKDFISLIIAFLFWFIGILLARMAAFIDPQMTRIFFKHLKYQDYYPATEKLESKVRFA